MFRTTKYFGRIWMVSLVLLAAVFSGVLSAHAAPIDPGKISRYTGGSECLAYNTEKPGGEVVKTFYGYCQEVEVKNSLVQVLTQAVKKVSKSTFTVTATPKVEETSTPGPTADIPEITSTPNSTQEPTQNPTIVPTEKPAETPSPEPTKECKNKNQWKDNTVDCNAGGGNG